MFVVLGCSATFLQEIELEETQNSSTAQNFTGMHAGGHSDHAIWACNAAVAPPCIGHLHAEQNMPSW